MDSVFHDLDGQSGRRAAEKELRRLRKMCRPEAAYQAWVETFIASEYEKMAAREFLSCDYVFAGMGRYRAVMLKEQLGSFVDWINANGSAFMGQPERATQEEIRQYIACHANDACQ